MAARTASVGVDVDSLCHYYRIHGLDESAATNAAWEIGVPRFVELFAEVGVPATFYCIAEDLETPGNAGRVRDLADAGHEVGNHTLHHRYDLSRLPPADMQREVAVARERLETAAGAPVVGFRAPGYNTTEALMGAVFDAGHLYDTSIFPCAPYYLAKASVLGWMKVRGRQSRSVLGNPSVLTAPADPYTMALGDPHRRGDDGGLQYPVSVAAGVPLIGTAFSALGVHGSLTAARVGLRLRKHLTIEFHAVDLLGLKDDSLDLTLAMQPDLKISVSQKRETFKKVLELIARRTRFERLDTLAREQGALT